VDLIFLAHLPWLILQPSVASTVIFYKFPHEPLAFLSRRFYREKLSAICVKEKNFKQCCTYSLDRNRHENSGYNPLLPQTFSVEIPSWMGFGATTCCCLGPFWWESLRGWDFRPQLIVVSGLSHELFSFFMMEFWLSQSLSHELFSFITMEFWLSRSLSHEFFSFFTMEF
jgi:hypothetical protein